MLNNTTNSKNQRSSKFLGNRRKRFFHHSQKECIVLPDAPHIPLQKQQSDIYCRMFHEGFYRVKYQSGKTGRSAFGYGPTIEDAFEAMSRNFNEKYNSHA